MQASKSDQPWCPYILCISTKTCKNLNCRGGYVVLKISNASTIRISGNLVKHVLLDFVPILVIPIDGSLAKVSVIFGHGSRDIMLLHLESYLVNTYKDQPQQKKLATGT